MRRFRVEALAKQVKALAVESTEPTGRRLALRPDLRPESPHESVRTGLPSTPEDYARGTPDSTPASVSLDELPVLDAHSESLPPDGSESLSDYPAAVRYYDGCLDTLAPTAEQPEPRTEPARTGLPSRTEDHVYDALLSTCICLF